MIVNNGVHTQGISLVRSSVDRMFLVRGVVYLSFCERFDFLYLRCCVS